MKRLRIALLGVFAICAFAAFTASASAALPVTLGLGAENEVSGLAEAEGEPIAQFNSTFATIKAGYVLLTFKAKWPFTLWKVDLLFKRVTLGTASCSTSGDAAGEVLIPLGEIHLVWISGVPWFLFSVPKTTINCTNGIKFTVEGSELVKDNTSGEATSLETETLCETAGSRKPKWKTYETDTGTGTAKLLANAGLGNEEVCEEVKAPLKTNLSEMLEIM